MARNGLIIPDETSVLCEGCGYTLDGLPTTGRCPECGLPIAQSTGEDGRRLPAWEDPSVPDGAVGRFLHTTLAAIASSRRFYRTLATRRQDQAALRFARIHWLISAILFASALTIHAGWYKRELVGLEFIPDALILFPLSLFVIFALLELVTRLAARLTAVEARYWGYRLPLPVVLRALYYHAAHYLPVAVVSFATVAVNAWLVRRHWIGPQWAMRYLYVLCGEVLVGAWYLFRTYWNGMKSMMFANH
jgi:hypothetical protein